MVLGLHFLAGSFWWFEGFQCKLQRGCGSKPFGHRFGNGYQPTIVNFKGFLRFSLRCHGSRASRCQNSGIPWSPGKQGCIGLCWHLQIPPPQQLCRTRPHPVKLPGSKSPRHKIPCWLRSHLARFSKGLADTKCCTLQL